MVLKDIAFYVEESISSDYVELEQYITTDNILQNKEGRSMAANLPPQSCGLTHYLPGDILVANIRPYLKKVWKANIEGGCSKDVLVIRAKENHYSDYLYAITLQDVFFENAMLGNKGTQMPRGDKDKIMEFPVFEHAKEDERKIGGFISKLQNKISLNTRLNAELETMAKQLYDYWFVQFDFPDENGKPYKSSGGKMVYDEKLKREIPEGWDVKELGSILILEDYRRIPLSNKERENKKGPFAYYGATGIMDYIDEYIFDGDYLLLAEDGSISDDNGNPVIQYIWGKNWVNNHAHIITLNNKNWLEYSYFFLKSIPVVLIETGSIQKKINQENLMSYNTAFPPDKLIESYCNITNSIREKQKRVTDEKNYYTHLRDSLLPMLMNGQVTIE